MKKAAILLILLLSSVVSAEFTIHILNPWADDAVADRRDSLRMLGNAHVGYYPGTLMKNEGNGWFYYVYPDSMRKSSSNIQFSLVTWIGDTSKSFNQRQLYGGVIGSGTGKVFYIDSLFAKVSTGVDEIWIELNSNSTKPPVVRATPVKSKVVNIFNPWPATSPKMIVGKNAAVQMRIREDLCGWYRYYFVGPVENLDGVTFTDYFLKQKYTSNGLATSGSGIDLQTILKDADTIYILPRPFPGGPPSLTTYFPGRLGDCNTRKVSAICRDWKLNDTSFFNNPMGMAGQTGHKGMVQPVLTTPDYKPKLTTDPSVNVTNAKQLGTWFNTITFPSGQKNDTCVDLVLTKSYDGKWTFDSDKLGGFFPIDNFSNPNNIKYLDNLETAKGKMHNFHFTMEMHMQFVYNEGQNLNFAFCGDDDVWIFINNRLAIDLGGLNNRAKDTLWLDKKKTQLQIADGQVYNMDIFFAERNPVGSNLLVQTNMDLRNSSDLFYKEKVLGNGNVQYDIYQQVKSESNDCGLTLLSEEPELAKVDFYIEGPSYSTATLLAVGTTKGGVIVDAGKSRVTIDSAKITDLIPGDYRITFVSTADKNRSGYVSFTVPPTPDHVDLLPDTMKLDLKLDAVVAPIKLGVEQDSILLYAVIRDKFGTYIEDGKNLIWETSDNKILSINPSTKNKAKATAVKNGGGDVWIIVSQAGLKADSILFNVDPKPVWPLIATAKMTDSKGNVVPDLIDIVMSDTFKSGQTLKTVEFTYKGKKYSVPGTSCIISGTSLKVPFTNQTGLDPKPSGSATLVIDVRGIEQRPTAPFTDAVGPALKSAEVLEREETELDVLYLTFTEPIDVTTLSGDNLVYIKNGTRTVISILKINEIINDSTYAVAIVGGTSIIAGDSLALKGGSQGGKIKDKNGNSVHERNPPVLITLRKGAAGIVNAWYTDENADGIIDNIFIKFKRPIDISELTTATIEINGVKVTLEQSSLTKSSDSVVNAAVTASITGPSNFVTGGTMYLMQSYTNAKVTRTVRVNDNAAPVIVTAKVQRGAENEQDSLILTFSEVTSQMSSAKFNITGESSNYTMNVSVLSQSGNKVIYRIDSTEPESMVALRSDSIWIKPDAPVGDTSGNNQTNLKNRRAALDVIPPISDWIAKVGPNPVDFTAGTVTVKLLPKRAIDVNGFNAKITIVDPTGNVVRKSDMELKGKEFIFVWNGYNMSGRKVGAGTYKVFTAVYNNGLKGWGDLFISVKR
jgi:fibro-slime domain-containing protein